MKWLLIVNIALFVLHFLSASFGYEALFTPFKLTLRWVTEGFAIWQVFTYMFLHDGRGFQHILFNMLLLWMFGKDLENHWGTRRFLRYYFICGVGAGLCVLVMNALFGDPNTPTLGASGAIYGLMLASAVLWPDRMVLFMLMFPMKMKYMVMILGGIAFLATIGSTGSGISHVAHLGGMLWGLALLKTNLLKNASLPSFGLWYRNWKQQRAKKKFQVYMRKHSGPGGDRMIH